MKIANITSVLFNKSGQSQTRIGRNALQSDVFQKSNTPSFRGRNHSDLSKHEKYSKYKDIILKSKREKDLRDFIYVFFDKKAASFLLKCKGLKMEEFIRYGLENTDVDRDFLIEQFNNADITTVFGFKGYLMRYNTPENTRVFKGQEIESLKIYSQLEDKEDFTKYGELLLYAHNKNSLEEDSKEKVDINKLTDFLKKINVSSSKDFEKKYSHLGAYFNNFESVSDKYDAVLYLMATYPEKIGYIDQISKEINPNAKINAEKIYKNYAEVIDYLYDDNAGNGLEPLSSIINQMTSGKLSPFSLKKIPEECCNFSSVRDRISFYQLLTESGVTIDDVNTMAKNSIINDFDFLTCIDNKNSLVKKISSVKNTSEAQSFDLYKKYSDALNVIYSQVNYEDTKLKSFFNIIDNFKIKDANGLLNLYGEISGKRQKSLSADQFEEFMDLMQYCSSASFIQDSRKKGILPIDTLIKEKENFLNVKNEIEEFLASDKSGRFLGLNALEIYLEYKDSINNGDSLNSVLDNITKLNIESSSDYEKKVAKLDSLAQYCTDRKVLFDFINKAGIKFDSTPEDDKYICNCEKLLKCLRNGSNDNQFEQRLKYVIKSGFVPKSKDSLENFFEKFKDNKEVSRILSALADRHAPSVESFMTLVKNYQSKNGKYDNILNQLENMDADITFREYLKILQMVETKLEGVNIPIKLDNDNISLLDMSYLKEKKEPSEKYIAKLLSFITNSENGNFIRTLNKSFTSVLNHYSSFDIASEILNKLNSKGDPYYNIISKLNIDVDDFDKDNDSIYLKLATIQKSLPKEFVDFVNSNDWISFDKNTEKIPNLSLHARLRLIDRFALEKCDTIDDLYTEGTKKHTQDVLKEIYTSGKIGVIDNRENTNIITMTHYDGDAIKTVFNKNGKMVTIIAKGR